MTHRKVLLLFLYWNLYGPIQNQSQDIFMNIFTTNHSIRPMESQWCWETKISYFHWFNFNCHDVCQLLLWPTGCANNWFYIRKARKLQKDEAEVDLNYVLNGLGCTRILLIIAIVKLLWPNLRFFFIYIYIMVLKQNF